MDLIERQAAIDAIYNVYDKYDRTAKVEEIASAIKWLPSAQPEQHGVCMDCLMKNICRFKTGLGDYGYCSQWRGEEP